MKYDVHVYATVRFKYEGIEAESQTAAIAVVGPKFAASEGRDADRTEYADEIVAFLVDEQGDEEYELSTNYDANGVEWPGGVEPPLLLLRAAKALSATLQLQSDELSAAAIAHVQELNALDYAIALIDGKPPVAADPAWLIRCTAVDHLWWSNETGWGSFEGATVFTQSERDTFNLPGEGEWITVPAAADSAPAAADSECDYGAGADPIYGLADWQHEVAMGDTRLGYTEWVEHQRDAAMQRDVKGG